MSTANIAKVKQICHWQHRRGPDNTSLEVSSKAVLAHNRLAIIDLDIRSNQPMISDCQRYRLVYNGELYNFNELKFELIEKGEKFKTTSDTEVLLRYLIRYGMQKLDRLNGIFAFAFYDIEKNEVKLVRDRFGIKPLYYLFERDALFFASSARALTSIATSIGFRKYSRDYFELMGNLPSETTHTNEVKPVRPGNVLTINRNSVNETEYFSVADKLLSVTASPVKSPSHADRSKLTEVIQSVFKAQSISDVKSTVWLSAGIDSSLLLYFLQSSGNNINALTLGFDEYKLTPDDEVEDARKFAKSLNAEHHAYYVDGMDFRDFMDDMDQPTIDGVNSWLISRVTNEAGVRVAFSGVGADELFLGYPSFSRLLSMQKLIRSSKLILSKNFRDKLLVILSKLVGNPKIKYLDDFSSNLLSMFMLYRAASRESLLLSDFKKGNFNLDCIYDIIGMDQVLLRHLENVNYHTLVTFFELHIYMQSQLLRDIDWASMSHSVEARVPFLDNNLFDFIINNRQNGIYFSKSDLIRTLPKQFWDHFARKKTGFTTPVKQWAVAAQFVENTTVSCWQKKVASTFWYD